MNLYFFPPIQELLNYCGKVDSYLYVDYLEFDSQTPDVVLETRKGRCGGQTINGRHQAGIDWLTDLATWLVLIG